MNTRRLMPKELFWIGAKGGLLEEKHRRAMRDAVWLFLYLLMRQTQINEAGEGVVRYGNPTSRTDIAADTGWSDANIKRWTARLIRGGYVRAVRSGNDGLIFFISKGKSKAKNPKPSTRYFPAELQPSGNYQVGAEMNRLRAQVGAEMTDGRSKNAPTYAANPPRNQSDARSSTTLIPKNLSNYNTTPLGQSPRSSLSSLLKETAEAKAVPRQMSQAEADKRRRVLLRQSEEIRRKYPRAEAVPA